MNIIFGNYYFAFRHEQLLRLTLAIIDLQFIFGAKKKNIYIYIYTYICYTKIRIFMNIYLLIPNVFDTQIER